ncbi:ABC transporter substrate-binding protein [Melittangium boletus]|uniref:ABC transporter substrate-binding protein n=1 Tax=Melittangium boletus TaxID=83453 RepID=UPI003DA438A4
MRTRLLMGVMSAVLATGCSFTTAAGLEECETSAECGADKVCSQGVCLPLPTGCGRIYGRAEAGDIPVGGLFPIHSGTEANAPKDESDEQAFNAALLAMEQVNARGINGKQFALYLCDTGGDAERARIQADWLVKEKQVAAVLTAGSSQTYTVAQSVTIPSNVLLMSYSASSPELSALPDTNGGPVGLVWRTSPSDAIQGAVIGQLLSSTTDARFGNPKKVAILYVNETYGQGLKDIVATRLAGVRENRSIPYPRRGNVRDAVQDLNTYDPDLTVVVGFTDDVTNILVESSTQPNLRTGSGHRWFFTDSVKDLSLLANSTAAAQAQNFYGTAPAQGTGQAFAAFRDAFNSRFKTDPSGYAYTSNAYDAMYLLTLGASYSLNTTGAVTGPKMAEALTKVSNGQASLQLTSTNFTALSADLAAGRTVNVDGASGKLDFDANGDAPAPMELWQVQGSNFVTVQAAIDPPASPP